MHIQVIIFNDEKQKNFSIVQNSRERRVVVICLYCYTVALFTIETGGSCSVSQYSSLILLFTFRADDIFGV